MSESKCIKKAAHLAHRILDAADLLICEASLNPNGEGKETAQREGFNLSWAVRVIENDVGRLRALISTELWQKLTVACPEAPKFNGRRYENWHIVVEGIGQDLQDRLIGYGTQEEAVEDPFGAGAVQRLCPKMVRTLSKAFRFDAATLHAMLARETMFALQNAERRSGVVRPGGTAPVGDGSEMLSSSELAKRF